MKQFEFTLVPTFLPFSNCFLVGVGEAAADTIAAVDVDDPPLPPVPPPMFCATYSRSSRILCTRKVFLPS